MTTRHMIHTPQRMKETWSWVEAFCAFDYGDPIPLAYLVQYETIPHEYREALAGVVSGVRKPNLKAAAKLKVSPAMMMMIARAADTSAGWVDVIHHHGVLEQLADEVQKEPIEVIDGWRQIARKRIKETAKEYKVSTETIENLMREMRKRIDRWPVV